MVEPAAIYELLDEFRFDEVDKLMEAQDLDPGLRDEITRRRADAEERAMTVCRQIIELGDERRLEEVAGLAADPSTRQLLRLVADASRKRAELYLREAGRWVEKRKETNTRRLTEARRALDGLDLELARGLMNRIDGRFLTRDQEEERDQLLLDIAARTMEMESLSDSGNRMIENDPQPGTRKPWWRRWSD